MRKIPSEAQVFIFTGTLDMRVGLDRLADMVSSAGKRAMSGGYYVFFSRTRDRTRIFYWDSDGYAMWTKRLEVGVFRVEKNDGIEEISSVDLEALLSGTDLSRIKFRSTAEKGLSL
jgi:transposase